MLYMKPIFWKPKMLVCTLRGEGGRGSEKVYCLYTHENVDIFWWSFGYFVIPSHSTNTLKFA